MRKRHALTIVLAIGMMIAAPISAQVNVVWDGSVDANWATAGNWVLDSLPTTIDDVTFDDVGLAGVGLEIDMQAADVEVTDMFISQDATGYNFTATGAGSLTVNNLTHGASGVNTITTDLFTTGAINVNAGRLAITGNGNSIGGAVNVNAGGILEARPLSLGTATITLNGGTASLSIGGGDGVSYEARAYDFESGDLTGWNIVPTAHGPDNLFTVAGNNPVSHSRIGPKQGTYYVDGYQAGVQGNSDGHTGIIETDSFVLGPSAQITMLVGGGTAAWAGDPDAPVAGLAGVGMERMVGAGDWENVYWETGGGNALTARSWDASAFEGETVRFRFYDTHTGGWGHAELDNLQISSVAAGGGATTPGNLVMTDNSFDVTGSSTLEAIVDAPSSSSFGALTLTDGTLTVTTPGTGTSFTSVSVPGTAAVGIDSAADVNSAGDLSLAPDADFTFTGGSLNVASTTLAGSATITVNSTVNGGILTLPTGTLTVAGAGPQNYSSIKPSGTSTIDITGGATVTALGIDDLGGPAIVNVTGNGTLAIDGSAGGTIAAGDTTLGVATGSTIAAAHAAAGPLGAGGATISLDGGTFSVEGEVIEVFDGGKSTWRRYNGKNVGHINAIDNGVDDGLNGGLFNETPDQTTTHTGDMNIGGIGDGYAAMWTGTYTAPATATDYWFRGEVDDDLRFYLDLDQDGQFESATELIVTRGCCGWAENKSVSLTAGQSYDYAFAWAEGGGGDYLRVQYKSPADGNWVWANPGARPAEWSLRTTVAQPITMPTTNFVVTANSNLIANTASTATFGELKLVDGIATISGAAGGVTFNSISGDMIPHGAVTGVTSTDPVTLTGSLNVGDNVDLTLGGGPFTLTGGITLNDDAADGIVSTIRAHGVLNWSGYNYPGIPVSLTQDGPGRLELLNLGPAAANQTVFTVTNGTIALSGATPTGGSSSDLNMDGGTIRITADSPIAFSPLVWDFEGDLNGWTVIPTGAAGNDDDAFAADRNPNGRENRAQHGAYHISTRNLSNPNSDSDNYEGILESPWFVIGDQGGGEQVSFLAGGGNDMFYTGDPDVIQDNVASITLERQVAPGDWELIYSSDGNNQWNVSNRTIATDAYVGDTMRFRIVDTREGGWGFVEADYFQVSSGGVPTIQPINLPSVNISVTNSSTLELIGPSATLGNVGLHNGVLTVDGPAGGTTFGTIAIDDGANTGLASVNPINFAGSLLVTNTIANPLQNMQLGGSFTVPSLTVGDGAKVSVADDTVSVATLIAGTGSTFAFSGEGQLKVNNYNDGAVKSVNVEGSSGGGTLFLDKSAGTIVANQTTFSVKGGGILEGQGATNPFGAAGTNVSLDGGTLKVSVAGGGGIVPPTVGDILAYWNYDEKSGSTIENVIDGGTPGTLEYGADITTGGLGYGGGEALNADADANGGTRGHMATPHAAFSNVFRDAFTWSVMVKTDHAHEGGIMSWSQVDNNWDNGSKALFVRNRGNRSEVEWDTGWVGNPRTGDFIEDGDWHHLVATYNPTGDILTIYIDGVAGYGPTGHGVNNNGENGNQFFHVGYVSPNFIGNEFEGLIDDVAIFNTDLQGDDLTRLLTEGMASFSGGPKASGSVSALNTNITVIADSTVMAVTDGHANLGALTLGDGVDAGGVLTVTGADEDGGYISFASATIANVPTSPMGFDTASNVRLPASIDFGGFGATIVKKGAGDLVLMGPATNVGAGAAFEVQAGRLIGTHASNPYGDGTLLKLTGGEIVLSSDVAGAVTYDNPVEVDGGGTLTAGKGGIGTEDNVVVTLDSITSGLPAFELTSGTVKLQTTDGYSLKIAGEFTGSGGVEIAGDVIYDHAPLFLENLTLTSGSLTRGADGDGSVEVVSSLTLNGLDLDMTATGDAELFVDGAVLTINSGTLTTQYPISPMGLVINGGAIARVAGDAADREIVVAGPGSYVTLGGGDLDMVTVSGDLVTDADTVLTVDNGSTLTVGNDLTVDRVIMGTGGGSTIDAPGQTITSDNSFNDLETRVVGAPNTINANLAGPGEMRIRHERPDLNGNPNETTVPNLLMTTVNGSHEYNGNTIIDSGGLNIGDVSVNTLHAVNGGHLRLEADGHRLNAQLMGHGALNMKIGQAQGQVHWDGEGGGFAAIGGDMTVTLTRNDEATWDHDGDGGAVTPEIPSPLDWNAGDQGFNGRRLKLGHYEADSKVEITNDIYFTGNNIVQAYDNPNTDQDVAELSGIITSNAGNWLRMEYNQDNDWQYNYGSYQVGTLWLSNPANTYDNTELNSGALRVGLDGAGLGTGNLYFRGRAGWPPAPNTLEAHGTFTRTIGGGAGMVRWSTDGSDRGGGFAAWGPNAPGDPGNDLTVTLVRGDGATWDHDGDGGAVTPEIPRPLDWNNVDNGFRDRNLMLGSRTANGVVTLTNDIDGNNGNRELWVWDNPQQTTDHAVMGGTLKNFNILDIRGDGEVVLDAAKLTDIQYLRIHAWNFTSDARRGGIVTELQPTATITGDYTDAGGTNNFIEMHNGGKLEFMGNVTIGQRIYSNGHEDHELIIHGDYHSLNNSTDIRGGTADFGGNVNINNGDFQFRSGITADIAGDVNISHRLYLDNNTGNDVTIHGDYHGGWGWTQVENGTLRIKGDFFQGIDNDDGIYLQRTGKIEIDGANVFAWDEIRVHNGSTFSPGEGVSTMNITFNPTNNERRLWFQTGDPDGGVYEWDIDGHIGMNNNAGDLIVVSSSRNPGLEFENDQFWTFRIDDPDAAGINFLSTSGVDYKVFDYSAASTNFNPARVKFDVTPAAAHWGIDLNALSLYDDGVGGIWLSGLVVNEAFSQSFNDEADGLWKADATWSGSGIPAGNFALATIDSHTVTVDAGTADATANTADVDGGTLDIDGTLTLTNVLLGRSGTVQIDGVLDTQALVGLGAAVNVGATGTLVADTANTMGMAFDAPTATLDVELLSVDSAIALADFTRVAGNEVRVAAGGTLTASAETVGAGENIDHFALAGGTLTGPLTTVEEWDFQSGTVAAGATLTGDFNIVVGLDRSSDGALIMNGTNSAADPTIVVQRGAVRGIPALHKIQLASNNDSQAAVVEVTANAAITLGAAVGEVNITDRGGFSAFGGDFTVELNGGAALNFGHFNGQALMLGSKTGTGSVELTNDIDFQNATRTVSAFSSDADPNFHSILSGNLTNIRRFNKKGDGRLVIPGDMTMNDQDDLYITGGTMEVRGTLNAGWNNRLLRIDGGNAKLLVGAGFKAQAKHLRLWNGGTIEVFGEAVFRENNFLEARSGSQVLIRSGGRLWDNNGNKTMLVDNAGTYMLIENGGYMRTQRGHIRYGANADIFGTYYGNENLYMHGGGFTPGPGTGIIHVGAGGSVSVRWSEVHDGHHLIIDGEAGNPGTYVSRDQGLQLHHTPSRITIGAYGVYNSPNAYLRLYDGIFTVEELGVATANRVELRRNATLQVDGVMNLTQGIINYETGTTLAGSGTINAGGIVNVGGTHSVAPGSSADTLTIAGALNMGTDSTYEWEITGHYGLPKSTDLIAVDGDIDFFGAWTFDISKLATGGNTILQSAGDIAVFTYTGAVNGFDPGDVTFTGGILGTPGWPDAGALNLHDDGAGTIVLQGLNITEAFDFVYEDDAAGDWDAGATWAGAPGSPATNMSLVKIDGNIVTTSTPAAANTLEIFGTGTLNVGNTLAVDNQLDVTETGALNVNAGGAVTADMVRVRDSATVGVAGTGTISTPLLSVDDTAAVTIDGTVTADSLDLPGGSVDVNNALIVNSEIALGGGGGTLTIGAAGTLTAPVSNTAGLTFGAPSATLDVGVLNVDTALALTDFNRVVGNDVKIVDGGTLTTAGDTVGDATQTVNNLTLAGGTLIDTVGLNTTAAAWDFQGGTVGAGTILNGDVDIVIGLDRTTDGTLVIDPTAVNNASDPKIIIQRGTLRGIPAAPHKIEMASNNAAHAAILEVTANADLAVGTAPGELNFTGFGGFSARGGDFTVTLKTSGGGATIDPVVWGDIGGQLMLGSRSGIGSVTLTNNLNFEGAERSIYAFASNDDANFVSRLSGAFSNLGRINKRGDGTLELAALTSTKRVNVFDGTLKPTGNLILTTGGRDEALYVDGSTAGINIPAGVTVDSNFIALYNNASADISGTMTTRDDWTDIMTGSDVIVRNGGMLQGGNNNADHNIGIRQGGTTVTILAGGKMATNKLEVNDGARLEVSGDVWNTNDGNGINVWNASTVIIRTGGIIRAGSNAGHTYTANKNSFHDSNSQMLIEAGGAFEVWRGHVRSGADAEIYGLFKMYENFYFQNDNGVINVHAGGEMFAGNQFHVNGNNQLNVLADGYVRVQNNTYFNGNNGTNTINGLFETNFYEHRNNRTLLVEGTALKPAMFNMGIDINGNGSNNDSNMQNDGTIRVGAFGTVQNGKIGNLKRWRQWDGQTIIDAGGMFRANRFEMFRNSRLIVNGDLELSGALEAYTGGDGNNTISGTGTITADTVIVGTTDILAPGGSTGILRATVTGGNGFNMRNGSIYEFEIGAPSDHDLVEITGKLNLDPTWTVKLLGAAGATGGVVPTDEIDIFTFSSIEGGVPGGLVAYNIDTSAVASNLAWDVSGVVLGVDADSVFITGLAIDLLNPVDTYTWNGSDPANWSVGTEWTAVGPPSDFDKGIVASGTSQVTADHGLHTLEISGTGAVDVQSDTLTVSNDLDITDTGSLTVAAGAAVAGVNGLNVGPTASMIVDGAIDAKVVSLGGTVALNNGAVLTAWRVGIDGGTTTIDNGVTVNGDFELNNGTLAITGNVALANLTFNGGGFNFGGAGHTLSLGTFRQNGGTSALGAGDNLKAESYDLRGGTVGFAMLNANGTPSTVTSGGNVTLAAGAAHTYTGTTTAESGTLTVNDPISATDSLYVLDSSTVNINAAVTTTSVGSRFVVTATDAMEHSGYHIQPEALMDLNNNGGLMATAPYATVLLTDGPNGGGLDFNSDADFINSGAINQGDNYMNLFIGYLNVTTAGNYTFRRGAQDDRSGIWFDLDQDGIFESSTPGLGSNRGEQLAWGDGGAKTVTLTPGKYLTAFTQGEYGGGSHAEFFITTPMFGEEIIKPAASNQAGLWMVGTTAQSTTITSGATVNINAGGILDTDAVQLDGTMNINAGGALDAAVVARGTLTVNDGDGLSDGALRESGVTIEADGRLNLATAVNQSSQMLIKTFGMLEGDLTNLVYSSTPGPGVVTFEDNALLDPTSGSATHPTLGDLGGVPKVLLPIKTTNTQVKAGEFVESFGDNGFKGGYIGSVYPDGGTFNGTLTSGAGDIYILQDRQVRYRQGTFNTASGNVQIDVVGGAVWSRYDSFLGSVTRVDIDFDPALNWQDTERMYFEEDRAVRDGLTVAFTNVRARTNNDWNFRGKVEVGEGASLFIHNNMRWDGVTDTGIHVKDGGVLWVSDNDRIKFYDDTKVTFTGETLLVLQGNNQDWNEAGPDGKIMLKSNILIVDNWAYQGSQGLTIGDGKYLQGGWDSGESRVHINSTKFRAEAGATWVGFAAFNRRWMNIDEPFDAQGADVRIGSETEMWTVRDHDTHTRLTEIPRGLVHFRQPVTNVGTMYQKSGELYVDNAHLNGTNIVLQGAYTTANNMEGGMQLRGTNWRLDLSTVTTEGTGFVAVENWNNDTKIGSLFINNANGLKFQGGEQLRIVTELGGTGSVELGHDGHIRMLAASTVAPGNTSAAVAGVGTLSVDDLFTDAGFNYEFELGVIDYDQVVIADRLELANAWTLKLFSAGGYAGPTSEYDLFTYGGSYAGTAGDITVQVTIDAGTTGWDITGATVMQAAGRVYVTGIDGLDDRIWKHALAGNWEDVSTAPSVNWVDDTLVDATPPAADTLVTLGENVAVTVGAAGQTAYQVDLNAGSLIINATGELSVGSSLNVATGTVLDAQLGSTLNAYALNTAGTTTLAGGGTIGSLNVTGGQLNTAAIVVDNFTAGGAATVAATGAITATADVEIASTFNTDSNVTAGGTLNLDGADDNVITVTGTSVFTGGGNTTKISNRPNVTITGTGDLTIKGPATSNVTFNQLTHKGFHENNDGQVMDLNNNGGMMVIPERPSHHATVLLTDGPGNRGLNFDNDGDFTASGAVAQNDNLSNIFTGFFQAPETGTYQWQLWERDDPCGIWIDLDQDGVFESSTPGLGANRGEQLSWNDHRGVHDVDLVAGEFYMVAFTHREGGGGSQIDIKFKTPTVDWRTVMPRDAGQDGLWSSNLDTAIHTSGLPFAPGGLFGALDMAAGAVLTLETADSATFESIAAGAGAIINGNITAEGAIATGGGVLAVNGSYLATVDSEQTWAIGDLIDVAAGVTLADGWALTIAEATAMVPGDIRDVIQFGGDLILGETVATGSGLVTNGDALNVTGDASWANAKLMYDGDSVFLVGSVDALWDGVVSGNWADTNWDWQDAGALKAPPSVGTMTINQGGTVAITAPVTDMVLELNVGGGGGGTLNVGSTIDVTTGVNLTGGGIVNVGTGGVLGTDTVGVADTGALTVQNGGTVNSAGLVGVGGTGSLTVDLGGTLNADTSADVAAGAFLVLNGEVNTPAVNSAGTTTIGSTMTGGVTQVNIGGGSTTISGDMTSAIGHVAVTGGTLVSGTGLQLTTLELAGGTADASTPITITDALTLGDLSISNVTTTSFDVSGGDVASGRTISLMQAGEVSIVGNALLPGTLGAWTFDDDTADDISGNGFNGNMGAGSYSGDVPATLAGGRSVDLRSNGWIAVETATNSEFNLDVMTVSFWAKEFPTDGWGAYVSKRGDGGNGWKIRRRGGDPWLIFTVRGKGNDDWGVPVDVGAFDSDWQHVIMTAGDGFRRIYVNDVLLGELAEGGAINDTGSPLMFGSWDNSNDAGNPTAPENGGGSDSFMDDIYILDRVVTAEERTKLFTNNFSLSKPGTHLLVGNTGGIVNINAGRVELGNLTFTNAVDNLEIKTAGYTSFGEVLLDDVATTITTPAGGGIGVRTVLSDSSGDIDGTDFTVDGSLTMEAGSALNVYGATISVTDFTNDGGEVFFAEDAVLNLTSSTLASSGNGIMEFEPDAQLLVNGGAGTFDLSVTGGLVILPDALPGDIGVLTLTGGELDGDSGAPLIVNDKLVLAAGEMAISAGHTFQVTGPNVAAERSLTLDTAGSTLSVAGAVIDTPNTHLAIEAGGITLDVTGGGPPQLGNLLFGTGQTEITIGTAGDVSFADVVLDTSATIHTPAGVGTIGVSGTAMNSGGTDLTGNLTIDGSLRVNTGGALSAVGSTVTAKSFSSAGASGFDATSSLALDGNVSVSDGATTFAAGSAVTGTVNTVSVSGGSLVFEPGTTIGGGTVNAINVSGGSLTTPAGVTTATLEVGRQGATMIAPEPVTVTQTAALGGLELEHTGPVGTSFTVQGLDLADDASSRTIMLNGGVTTTGGGAPEGLKHRYSFDEAAGATQFNDSVGTAHITLQDLGGSGLVGGQGGHSNDGTEARLYGGDKNNSDWLKVPNGTISALTGDATFEFWATHHSNRNWSRIFSWGGNNNDVLHTSWTKGTNINDTEIRWRDGSTAANNDVDNNIGGNLDPFTHGQEFHIVVKVDAEATGAGTKTVVTAYKDGVLMPGSFDTFNLLSDLGDTENALGRSKWGDNTADASYNEFRIYDVALDNQAVADSFAAGADGLSGAADLTATTIGAAAGSDSTLALNIEAGLPAVISGIDVGNAATLTFDSPVVDIELTNMTLRGGGSMFKSSYAAADAPVTVTVSEKLSTSGGGDFIGDPGAPGTGIGADGFFTNLTLVDGVVPAHVDIEWTLTSNALTDVDLAGTMIAVDDAVNVFGTVDLAAGLTIQLVDGLAPGVNAIGVDVALFKVSDLAIIDGVAGAAWSPADVAKITVLGPAGEGWTHGGLGYLNDEYIVLLNLLTGVQPGDATGDNIVNFEDVIVFNAQLGQRGAGLSCDWIADGVIDLLDFQVLKDNMGFGTGGGAPVLPESETPEPATMSLLALGGLLILRRRRRKA